MFISLRRDQSAARLLPGFARSYVGVNHLRLRLVFVFVPLVRCLPLYLPLTAVSITYPFYLSPPSVCDRIVELQLQ